ncbi:uncharacterized protein LOC143914057 [Arctopsyche grandis]|uniref:uncharacterized protein LOC143914057 n=1 Tax=Arctopsyche grandis TaxID=121162 RepID=UPI00406D713C
MLKYTLAICFLVAAPLYVQGHGMVLDPVNRASRWRVDSSAPPNYGDNQLWCGGAGALQNNGGKCGMCGDNFAMATPRTHELGGKYGQGVIVKKYQPGSVINVEVRVTANHRGWFEFRICNKDRYGAESDACFNDILLASPSGEIKHTFEDYLGNHYFNLRLPSGLICQHCILQWTYFAHNTRENYRTCSDISISA